MKPNWSPFWVPEATRRVCVKRLIDHCRTKDVPVIFTRTPQLCGSAWTADPQPVSGLGRGLGDVLREWPLGRSRRSIGKSSSSSHTTAPYDTPLETVLRFLQKSTVIICGTLIYCCGTTRQAFERGFQVLFGTDITVTDDPDMQEPELQ